MQHAYHNTSLSSECTHVQNMMIAGTQWLSPQKGTDAPKTADRQQTHESKSWRVGNGWLGVMAAAHALSRPPPQGVPNCSGASAGQCHPRRTGRLSGGCSGRPRLAQRAQDPQECHPNCSEASAIKGISSKVPQQAITEALQHRLMLLEVDAHQAEGLQRH